MKQTKPLSSEYINEQRRNYSIYVMTNRAIPAATDGLKSVARRILWMAKDGKIHKSNTLAAETTAIHPHDAPDDVVGTLAAPYNNNIPLLQGDGAFGTLLLNKEYGASRYTKVRVSKFTQDVIFRDLEIVPMVESYDGTLEEPKHLLPLVPIALVNSTEGIAIGFASNILPRALEDIVLTQIQYLKGVKSLSVPMPKFLPTNNVAYKTETQQNGNEAFWFQGECERVNRSTIRVTNLPYGLTHDKFTTNLNKLADDNIINDYDDNSRDHFNIDIKFSPSQLDEFDEESLLKLLLLDQKHVENLNVLDFTGNVVWSTNPVELICKFSDWRLEWYVVRYERLLQIAQDKLQQCRDIQHAIQRKVSVTASKSQSRSELKEVLKELKIVNIDYIADLPVYRFTDEEYDKNQKRIEELHNEIEGYKDLLTDEKKRRKIYIKELEEILKNYSNGDYTAVSTK